MRGSNTQARRLIFSQRQAHSERDTNFPAIPTDSFGAVVHFREESVAHFVQHGAGRLTPPASDRREAWQTLRTFLPARGVFSKFRKWRPRADRTGPSNFCAWRGCPERDNGERTSPR